MKTNYVVKILIVVFIEKLSSFLMCFCFIYIYFVSVYALRGKLMQKHWKIIRKTWVCYM